MRKCPYCAEEIQDEAMICKHCHSALSEEIKYEKNYVQNQTSTYSYQTKTKNGIIQNTNNYSKFLCLILPIIMFIGLFIPVLVFPNLRDAISTTNYWGGFITGIPNMVKFDAEISQIDIVFQIFTVFDSIDSDINLGGIFVLFMIFSFTVFTILSIFFYVLSAKHFTKNILQSFLWSIISIIVQIIMNLECVSIYFIITIFIKSNFKDNTSYITSYYLSSIPTLFKLDFPISAFMFTIIGIILIGILLKAKKTISAITTYNIQPLENYYKNDFKYCYQCGTKMDVNADSCPNCKQKALKL